MEITELSRRAGWQVTLGTDAMIYQGLEQDIYWMEREMDDLPVRRMKEAIAEKLSEMMV
jgi:quinate dehydrogenase